MNFTELYKVSIISFLSLLFFSLYFYLVGYKEDIPLYIEFIRVIFSVHYVWLISIILRFNISKDILHIYLFLSFIFLSYVLQNWRLSDAGFVFGGSNDAYSYLLFSTKYNDLSLFQYWHKLLNYKHYGYNLDDTGFMTIMYFIGKPFNKEYLAIAKTLILCNSIIYYIGVLYFHKLCDILLESQKRANVTTVLWSSFSVLITTNADGLKEVFFTSFIIIAMYSIYNYKEKPTFLKLSRSILLIFLSLFFRFAIFYALVLSLICIILVNERNKKTMVLIALSVLLLITPILALVLPILTNISLEDVLLTNQGRKAAIQNSAFTKFISEPISLLFGPFPNFNRMNGSGFMYSYSLLLKDFLSIYFLSTIINIIRGYIYKFYPLLVLISCNLLMCIVAGVSLDIRYHITYIPFFFIICMVPIKCNLHTYMKFFLYLFICSAIFFYSNRNFKKDRFFHRTICQLDKNRNDDTLFYVNNTSLNMS